MVKVDCLSNSQREINTLQSHQIKIMPYKDKAKQAEYCNNRLKVRRLKWFQENGPCVKCGSNERLELDHIDPSTKVDHKIWSWNKERQEAELAKCQVLCYNCHLEKTRIDISKMKSGQFGEKNTNSKLTDLQAKEIREKYNTGLFTQRELGKLFNVSHVTINSILSNKTYPAPIV